jgi:hypothetical protein
MSARASASLTMWSIAQGRARPTCGDQAQKDAPRGGEPAVLAEIARRRPQYRRGVHVIRPRSLAAADDLDGAPSNVAGSSDAISLGPQPESGEQEQNGVITAAARARSISGTSD